MRNHPNLALIIFMLVLILFGAGVVAPVARLLWGLL